jgi:hypothetical protein
VLVVKGSFAEPGAPQQTAFELAEELGSMAGWLELDSIRVEPRGDLAHPLSLAVKELHGA